MMTDVEEEKLNGRDKPLAAYWVEGANEYKLFSEGTRSPNFEGCIVETTLASRHLLNNPNLPRIGLDLGCHKGASTQRALMLMSQQLPDEKLKMVGLDSVPEFVFEAQRDLASNDLQFMPCGINQDLPFMLKGGVGWVQMDFVDQVIPLNRVLLQTMKKGYDALAQGGIMVMMRLAEESFDKRAKFVFYGHNTHLNRQVPKELFRTPEPFKNELRVPQFTMDANGEQIPLFDTRGNMMFHEINFVDYYRSRQVIQTFLHQGVGFKQVRVFPLHNRLIDQIDPNDDLGKLAAESYLSAHQQMIAKYPMLERSDDGKIPLVEIVVAVK